MTKVLNVYSHVPQSHTASWYYRILGPLKAMNDLGLPVHVAIDTDLASIKTEDRIATFCEADICLMYQPIGQAHLGNIRQVYGFIPSLRDGEWKYPPSVVVESDDNLFHVSPLNPAYQTLGSKDPQGREVASGKHIGLVQNGERVIRWIDGHQCSEECGFCGKGIDFAGNREGLNTYRRILEMVDALTCSTPKVEEQYLAEARIRKTKVFPNCIRFDDYEQVDVARDPGKVVILWQGGHSHYEDWYPLRRQLARVLKRHPEAHLVIWGTLYHWVMDEIPAERYTHRDWVPYPQYKDKLSIIAPDINLAPLSNTRFNQCRSSIKWMEAAALKRPAATLAQRTGPYEADVQDRQTGLLFDNPEQFEDRLSELIQDAKLRKELGQNARQWIKENRNMLDWAPKVYEFWRSLREDRKREQPHPTDREWQQILAESEAEEEAMRQAAQKNGNNMHYDSRTGAVEPVGA